jgi:hypothetical protein
VSPLSHLTSWTPTKSVLYFAFPGHWRKWPWRIQSAHILSAESHLPSYCLDCTYQRLSPIQVLVLCFVTW